jgi:hypothetical protein
MIVKQRGMDLVKFTENLGNDGFPHKFRFITDPELPAVLIDSLYFVIIERNGGFIHPFQVMIFMISGTHNIYG